MLRATLKHDSPNWRLLNSCPACTYKLQDEPPLEFDWFAAIDGNNSLKRWASWIYGSLPQEDMRQARSDYWVTSEAVDKFQDEVKTRMVSIGIVHNILLVLTCFRLLPHNPT